MQADDFISYLAATDQLDEFLGLKKEDEQEKCINCSSELKKIKETLLYCKNCGLIYEKNNNNKKLIYKTN